MTDEKLKELYDTEIKSYTPQEEIKARHILLGSKKEADDILIQLKAGADFETLANTKSLDTENKGGELGYFTENTSVFGDSGAKRSYTDKIRKTTVAFIIFKNVFMLLPELSDIMNYEYSDNYGLNNIYSYIGTVRFLCFIPVLVFGIVWLCKMKTYFGRISKDNDFIEALESVYKTKVLPKKGIFVRRAVKHGMIILLFAMAFTADFRLDGVNLFPDFIAGAIAFLYFKTIEGHVRINKKLSYLSALFYFVASAAHSVTEFLFLDKYGYASINRSVEAQNFYFVMIGTSVVSTIAFFALFVAVVFSMSGIISEHVGVINVSDQHRDAQISMNNARKRELQRNNLFMMIFFSLYVISDVVYAATAGDMGWMFTVNLVCAIIFICLVFKSYNDIYISVENSYLLE
jgi:hypothetical protein